MAVQTVKERLAELAGRLRDAAKLEDPVALAAVELVKLSGDEAKESLVVMDGNDMLRMQGAARHLRALYRELTTTPPSITKEQ